MTSIVKVESRTDYTKSGKPITIYRRTKYKPDHPDYAKELKLKQEFEKKATVKVVPK